MGHDLHIGIGLSTGYATLGVVGFEGRADYTAVGSVMNQAARLCAVAAGGEILASDRFVAAVESLVEADAAGEMELQGFRRPLMVHKVLRLRH